MYYQIHGQFPARNLDDVLIPERRVSPPSEGSGNGCTIRVFILVLILVSVSVSVSVSV
jgi:hypothetical protein